MSREGTLVLLLACVVAAGCTAPSAEPERLLQETIPVGADLYTWAVPDFSTHGYTGPSKRLRADFDAPAEVVTLGVRLVGILNADNASLSFALDSPSGDEALRLVATNGLDDDFGTIRGFFTFNRVIASMPGEWKIRVDSAGPIGQLEFSVRGIYGDPEVVTRSFTVSDGGREPLVMELFVQGWGEVPAASVAAPDGQVTHASLSSASDDTKVTLPVAKGNHTLRFDVTGWGGSLHVLVRQG